MGSGISNRLLASKYARKPPLVYTISIEEIVDAVGHALKLTRDLFYGVTRNGEGRGGER
jgi:hypothetical protein